MHIYHLITGSNLGNRTEQLRIARQLIQDQVGPIRKESAIYETQPWGYDEQPWFLNQALEVHSSKSPLEVLQTIKQIEVQAGRTPGEKWHARHIDIDILLAGQQVINQGDLIIPHPHMASRNFVLVPLMEIAAETIHPVLGKTIEEIYFEGRDTGEVYIFNPDEQV